MKKFLFVVIALFSLMPAALCAQYKKAMRLYDNYEYVRAIKHFKRSAVGKNKLISYTKIAECCIKIKDFKQAEIYFSKALSLDPDNADLKYKYAGTLLNNGKYDDAKKQFQEYLALKPNDSKVKYYIRSCDEMKTYSSLSPNYKIYNLKEINTNVSDYSPAMYKGGLVFVSEGPRDLVSGNENNWNGNPYSSIFYSKAEMQNDSTVYKRAKIFAKIFNNDAINGPASFTADGNELFFTKTENKGASKKSFTNQPKIYYSKNINGNWLKPTAMPFCSDEYSTAHPAITKDGQTLYFASSMPGGQGGTDIYMVKRTAEGWNQPQNLGTSVNTAGDEMFPVVGDDGRLYFSSNGLPGYGGLDIYSTIAFNGNWTKPQNMFPPINSSKDDFGIIFKTPKSGYFSSNRDGGKGADDLYGFYLTANLIPLTGNILQSKQQTDGVKNLGVMLLTNKGEPLQYTNTDENGKFKFDNLNSDMQYMIKLDETDDQLKKTKYYLSDDQNKLVKVTLKGTEGVFVFNNLPADLRKLNKLVEEEDSQPNFSIGGSILMGDDRVPVSNKTVSLKNEKGEIIQTATTNDFGSFVFTNLPSDQNYLVTIDNTDPTVMNKKLFLVNKSGKEVAMDNGTGKFQIFSSDKMTLKQMTVPDADLRADLKGLIMGDGQRPLNNSKVNLINEKGEVVQTTTTDAQGKFVFTNLPADKKYLVTVDETDANMKEQKSYYVTDAFGNVIKKLILKNGKYTFEVLPTDQRNIASIYFDDPWLQVQKLKNTNKKDSITIIENIYYDYGKWDLLPEAKIVIDKVVKVMKQNGNINIDISAFTDSRGTDDFNNELSKKRAQAVVDYIVSKGIDKKRLTGKGLGESKLINKCKDGIECTEDEHAQNRRTEFKIVKAK
jgi:outer membrane protein OmpA-like peptidoglycan-associated protein